MIVSYNARWDLVWNYQPQQVSLHQVITNSPRANTASPARYPPEIERFKNQYKNNLREVALQGAIELP